MFSTLRLRSYGRHIERLEEADIVLREVDSEIMVQHETIFAWLAEGEAEQTAKGNPYD